MAADPRLQGLQCGLFEPVELHRPLRDPVGQSGIDAVPLRLDVELGHVGRRGDDDEDAQRPVDVEGARGVGDLEVADDGSAFGLRDEAVLATVVEQLPGQHGDGGRLGQPEPQSQTTPRVPHRVDAARPGEPDVAAEDGVEQPAAEVQGGLRLRVGGDPASVRAARVQLEHEVLELGRFEGDPEGPGRALPRRRVDDARAVPTVALRLDQEVEVVVLPGGHEPPPRVVPSTKSAAGSR